MTRKTPIPLGASCACGAASTCGSDAEDRLSRDDRPGSAERRWLLQATLAAGGLALPFASPVLVALADDAAAKNARPKEGDQFVFVSGDKQGQVITPADLLAGAPQVMAWPMDPASKTVRDGSRLNQVLLLRVDPADLDDATKPRAAEGILAYSAICTHAQCPVVGWNAEKQVLHCACHQSDFDPRQGGKKVAGPAPRPLPALPLKTTDGALVAAGTFLGKVGASSA